MWEQARLRAFAAAMGEFMSSAAEGVRALGQGLVDMQRSHVQVAGLFAEDTAKLDAGALYARLLSFHDELARAAAEVPPRPASRPAHISRPASRPTSRAS
uniref:Uncharacterized protein n=1 Tax=Cryptomonas curvata TaxID=233186 RepID=A0A7S0MUK0_9CRYP|mmetsp:Transcript_53144/g.110851  ORF Transcript_53144/g.110851 Transcript_53144/m.110851 type:complete len:100 (+) Transcript_53144:272-571(+)|eukprot:CAMPEP_0172179522 /NCGR_PEP_ID=MMETSP1050-20130122/16668_1 /TAXON_ID=233186 /ORGANISM="Cryptomonas curvata, Strain CCAP979/52" /LENGTH=99 /DNA_ID=CAMNT_0012852421 /DNA_START=266 /DNA_END=565 /DNA_ORIENTATION=+